MDDDHFKVALLVCEIDEVLDSSMRLHYQIDEIFVDDVEIGLEEFL